MQTAVDCNGSSSNTTTISTTITTTTTEHDNNPNGTMTQHHQQQPQQQHHPHHQPHSLMHPTPETENTNILRHRVNTTNTNNGTPSSAITATKNGLSHLIDAAEYTGSNVECMSVTPSSSTHASPSKGRKLKGEPLKLVATADGSIMPTIFIPTPLQDTYKTNTSSESSSSKTASNSTSTTSSVIATPVLKRNGNIFKGQEPEDRAGDEDTHEDNIPNRKHVIQAATIATEDSGGREENAKKPVAKIDVAAAEECKQFRECNNKQLLTNQMLPFENTSSTITTIIKKELSSSSLPMSSSTTSLSITTPAAAASSSTTTPSPSSSSSNSSSSASTTSATPASATTTPALLSTPSSSSSSSSPPSSSASCSSSSASPSPTSPESKIKDMSISGLVEAELLQWQDMPQYLQFNPYVLKGYRPLQTFKGCLLSLFYWHNETINILTHAIPIVYILAIVPGLMPWHSGYRFLSFCHVFGSVAPWCGSFVYHLFMNIERGENVYYRLLKLDMVGIWVSQSFGALPLVTATTFCFTNKWKWLIIMSYCVLSLWGLYKALTASSPWQRRLCFALPFTMRSILTFFRTMGLVGGNRVALEHVYLQDVVSILGGAIGAMRIPEKWFPGLVDFYLNSHNIMHVLVVVAVYSMHKATVKDFEWMESTNCDAFVNVTSKVLETTLNTKIEL
ncbi:uncharacterized protein LOC135958706 [Calliphora vicina]|uniref:uncharacterized protein LOC135958706 n=1 Tax=Calliphora vicina TaxID=7373 RepID=UPI00325C0453